MLETQCVIIMATTVQQAVRLLLRLFSITGLTIHFQEKVYLSIVFNLAIWIGYMYLYYYIVIAFRLEELYLNFNEMSITIINFLSCVTSVILSVFYDKRFRTFMKRLAAVDDTLAKLGTLKIYHKLQIYVKRLIIVYFIYIFFGNVANMIWWYAIDNHWCIIILFILSYMRNVPLIVDMIFWIFLWYIGTRFEEINKHMRSLLIKEDHALRCTRSVSVNRQYMMRINNYKCIFWTLMHLHLELCQISRELNAIFGLQITLEMMESVMILTEAVIYIFMNISSRNLFLNIIDLQYWILLYIIRIFWLNYLCETVSAKAKQLERIPQVTHFLRYADIRNEIHQFSLQLIHHPLKFTGLGLFEFGYAFLKKMFSTVITFVILGIQK